MANRNTKDKVVRDGFNPNKKGNRISKEEERRLARKAMLEKKRLEAEKAHHEKEATKLANKIAKSGGKKKEEGDDDDGGDGKPDASFKTDFYMLRDMRAAYKKLGGKKKLIDMLEEDDKQFVFMVKELMKVETALITARIRVKDDMGAKGNQTVFVVLKGLEDAPITVGPAEAKESIDLRQIAHVLTPDGTEYEG